jgi:hypothetical protein
MMAQPNSSIQQYTSMAYSVHFWDAIQASSEMFAREEIKNLFASKLTKKDFACVRDLYLKVKLTL